MSTSTSQPGPLHQLCSGFPVSDDGTINLDAAPTADLIRLATAILTLVARRRSERPDP